MAQILVVEDEVDLRENLEIVLSHAGHTVTTAGNGCEALAIIVQNPPDLVISDLSMPEMTGFELLTTVRQDHPELAEMPILLLTAYGDKENLIAGRESGADDFLTKPVDYQVLLATLEARLARRQQASTLKETQFVRLFKGLQQKAEGSALTDSPSPLERIAELASFPLKGRISLLMVEDFYRDYGQLPRSMQEKLIGVMERLIREVALPADVLLALGGGVWLLALATEDRTEAGARLDYLHTRLSQTIGTENRSLIDGVAGKRHRAGADGEKDDPALSETLQALFSYALHVEDAGGASHLLTFPALIPSLHLDYLPIWSQRSQAVEMFRVRCLRTLDGVRLPEDRTLLHGASDRLLCDLQSHILDQVIRDLMAARISSASDGKPLRVMVPLALPVFQNLNTYKIVQQLTDAARLAGSGRLGFVVTHAGSSVSSGLLRHVFNLLAPVGGPIFLDYDANDSRIPGHVQAGCRGIHLDAAAALSFAGVRQDRLAQGLLESLRTAVKDGFAVWVSGVDQSDLARSLIAAGATFLSGKLVGEAKPQPERAYPLAASKVLLGP